MASLPGAVMKKSSGYGSALSLARAISVSARAGDSGSLGCGSGQPPIPQRWVSLACSQSSAAATSPQRTSSQRHSRLSGVAAFFNDSASWKVRLIAAAKRCQRARRANRAWACWLAPAAAYPAISPSYPLFLAGQLRRA